MRIDYSAAASLLREQAHITILTHGNPDGDTLGCAYALAYALHADGKRVQVLCPDAIPACYDSLRRDLPQDSFTPGFVVAVDVADPKLLGSLAQSFVGRIDLCIDHHGTNTGYAANLLLDADAAAAAEVLYFLLEAYGSAITPPIANCLYVGIATDTGCFCYASTTAQSHRIAATLMDFGAQAATINRIFFETKKESYFALQRLALDGLHIYDNGQVAIMPLLQSMYAESGASSAESDRLSAIPRQIEGVLVGATMKEQPDGYFKISVRTHAPADASAICAALGGGGHIRAAGCRIEGPLERAREELLGAIRLQLKAL